MDPQEGLPNTLEWESVDFLQSQSEERTHLHPFCKACVALIPKPDGSIKEKRTTDQYLLWMMTIKYAGVAITAGGDGQEKSLS